MNIVKRLRCRETTNVKQQFLYTATILDSFVGQPDIVVPIRESIQPTTISRLLRATENFFRCHDLPLSFGYTRLKLFHVKDDNFEFHTRYILIYGYTGDKSVLDFNDVHKHELMTDVLLQEETTCD